MDITVIRQQNLADLAPLCAQATRERKAGEGFLAAADESGALALLSAHLEASHRIWAAREESRFLGYLVTGECADGAALLDLYVDESVRRQGVGRALFEQAARKSEEGGGELIIEVHPNHDELILFFKAMGYLVLDHLRLRPIRAGETFNHSHRLGRHRFRSHHPVSRRRRLNSTAEPGRKRKKKKPRRRGTPSEWSQGWGEEFGQDDYHYFIVGFTSGGAAYGVTWEQAWQDGLISEEEARERGLVEMILTDDELPF